MEKHEDAQRRQQKNESKEFTPQRGGGIRRQKRLEGRKGKQWGEREEVKRLWAGRPQEKNLEAYFQKDTPRTEAP